MKNFNLYYNRGFKTGINPCEKMKYHLAKLTPIQKLKLTQCRIFKETIGDMLPSDRKHFKKRDSFRNYNGFEYLTLKEFNHLLDDNPDDPDRKSYFEMRFEERKQRVLMRGIKIGRKKTATGESEASDVFAQKKTE